MTTTLKPIKRAIPTPTVKPTWEIEDEHRTIDFGNGRKLQVRNSGQPDDVVAAVARQFCSRENSYGVSFPSESDGINEVLFNIGIKRNITESREHLEQLLDYPVTAERIEAICPFWYPCWAEQFLREEIIEAARCVDSKEVWNGYRGRKAEVVIDTSSIHQKLIDRVIEEFPALFEDPE